MQILYICNSILCIQKEAWLSSIDFKYPPTSMFVDTLLQIVRSKSTPVDGVITSFYNDYDLYRRRFYLWINMINYLFHYWTYILLMYVQFIPLVMIMITFLFLLLLPESKFLVLNGIAESMNATISTLLFNTKGIRNTERRRKQIMYVVNKTGFLLK